MPSKTIRIALMQYYYDNVREAFYQDDKVKNNNAWKGYAMWFYDEKLVKPPLEQGLTFEDMKKILNGG